MSTRKNGVKTTTKPPLASSLSKSRTSREPSSDRKNAKKEETPVKTRISSRSVPSSKKIDEEKVKKTPASTTSTTRRVNIRPAVRKTTKTASKPGGRPVTPPSSRVTKTQFFPSKKMYSHALQGDDPKTTAIRDISPSDTSSDSRPRTATLRKGSIVNNNIVGPDAPQVPKRPDVEEYEDDFDSYQSDFEEYQSSDLSDDISTSDSSSDIKSTDKQRVNSASTDDEKKMDSGNYELPEFRHKQILDNIKESIEKENANLDRSNLGSLSDEGFEDGKSSMQFINFLGAQRKYQHRKSIEKRRKRGEEILSMIRLDNFSFTLYDAKPVPYEVFIKSFGKSNLVQASVQTGEDDLDEEVQTDEIVQMDKWTQFPPAFPPIDKDNEDFWQICKCNYLGVGGDVIQQTPKEKFRESDLDKFLLSTGSLILNIQAEETLSLVEDAINTQANIPFSKELVLFNTRNLPILQNRPLKDVSFCATNLNRILTVHGTTTDSLKSLVCVWNICNVKEPEMYLGAFGEVTTAISGPNSCNIILAGLRDGTISIWDTRESCHFHILEDGASIRSPTFTTQVNTGHLHQIISMESLSHQMTKTIFSDQQSSAEICSLDEDGELIIWSVISKEVDRVSIVENQGLAHWGSVIIALNTRVSLKKLHSEFDDFKCTGLTLSQQDSNHLFIATNYGVIIHCLANGTRPSITKFLPDTATQANYLEICPFSPYYFIVGFDNGDINIYSRLSDRALTVMSNKDNPEDRSKIRLVQWSFNRPFIFYTVDITNTLHVWNLKTNNTSPALSIPFTDNIVALKLTPVIKTTEEVPERTYMMIALENGKVYLHLLADEHSQLTLEEFAMDKTQFVNNMNRFI